MASDTSGVKPFSIAGRLVNERERLHGMTTEERAWRAQWIKDQHLTENEPKHVPEYWKNRFNPIRRFYRAPLDKLQGILTPSLGADRAYAVRYFSGKALISIATIYLAAYYFKYNANDWTRKGGWRVIRSRNAVVPGDAEYPKLSDRSLPSDYAARGFKDAPI